MSGEKMNIAYFSNQFAESGGHGIAHYARRVYEGICANHSDISLVPVSTWSNRTQGDILKLKQETGLVLLPWGRKLTPLAWTFFNAPPIEHWLNTPIDITHIVSLGFPVATRRKLVVTVHDIGPLTHPEYFYDNPWKFKRSFLHMLRYADAIICVSKATADEVIGYVGDSNIEERISVVREGVDRDFFQNCIGDVYSSGIDNLPPQEIPFFFSAGAISPRKNIRRVLESFAKIKDSIPHHYILAGGRGWKEGNLNKYISELGLAGRVHRIGHVSDEQLCLLYKTASFYIHPSLFEGFGLTVLEAMAAGCPVITSNISSLPEVAGDAALLVNPFSVTDIAEAMEELASSDILRQQLIVKGNENVGKFNWGDTADGIVNIYRSLW